jgi:hypothetical protein
VTLDGERFRRQIAAYEQRREGKPVELRGFMSTSKGKGFGGNVMIYVDARGYQGASVQSISHYASEREVFFPHRSRFLMDRVESVGSPSYPRYEVYLKEDRAADGPLQPVVRLRRSLGDLTHHLIPVPEARFRKPTTSNAQAMISPNPAAMCVSVTTSSCHGSPPVVPA